MELIRGFKPLTDIERAFAAEQHRQLKYEIVTAHALDPDLLDYDRGYNNGHGPSDEQRKSTKMEWKHRRLSDNEQREKRRLYMRAYMQRRKALRLS